MKIHFHFVGVVMLMAALVVTQKVQADVLWDNGTFINSPGGMTAPAGADRSHLTTGATIFGTGHSIAAVSIAEDFTLANPSTINSLTFYGYLTGATAPGATFLAAQIWNGAPNVGGSAVVWGDLTTNILTTNQFMAGPSALGVYRTTGIADTTSVNRRLQEVIASGLNVNLPAGSYWIQWGTTGISFTPPMIDPANPDSLAPGQNGLQFSVTTGAWTATVDGTTPVGFDFLIEGTAIPEPGTLSLLAIGAVVGMLRRRK